MVSGFVTLIIFLLALGGMIFVHELGHFIAARWAGVEVGGLVISKLGRPPVVGDEVVYNDKIHIRVLAVEGRAVSRVLVEFPHLNRRTDEDTAVSPPDNTK